MFDAAGRHADSVPSGDAQHDLGQLRRATAWSLPFTATAGRTSLTSRTSTEIGHNDMAQFIGSQEVTVTQKYDIVIDSAGGPFQVPGDYLYQAFNQEQKMGIWGLFRVTPAIK